MIYLPHIVSLLTTSHSMIYLCHIVWRPSKGFEEQGKQGIYFRGTGEQRPNFEGNRGTKTILGNRAHKKTNFRFLGNRGTSQFISGEQGNRYPLGGPQYELLTSHNMGLDARTLSSGGGGVVNNKGADQHAHPRSLISTFVIHLSERIISRLATSEISIFS